MVLINVPGRSTGHSCFLPLGRNGGGGTILEVGAILHMGIYVSVRWTDNVQMKNEDPSATNRATVEQRKPNSRQRRSKRHLENLLARKKAAVGLPAVQAERQRGRSRVELEDRFSRDHQSTEMLDSLTYASVVAKMQTRS